MTPSERYPRGTAYHEAGHAVVAWSLGLPVGAVSVSDEDASGSTQIGLSDHLPLIEQIAVCSAGIAAVEIFGHPIHELAGFKDHERIMRLIEVHGISEEGQGPALRKEGYSFARARLEAHWSKVAMLAELLVEHGLIEAGEVMLLMQLAAAGDASDDDGRRLQRDRLADSAVGTTTSFCEPAAGEGGGDQPDQRQDSYQSLHGFPPFGRLKPKPTAEHGPVTPDTGDHAS